MACHLVSQVINSPTYQPEAGVTSKSKLTRNLIWSLFSGIYIVAKPKQTTTFNVHLSGIMKSQLTCKEQDADRVLCIDYYETEFVRLKVT